MVSVCMATYNGERFIREQIESILSQLSDNDELIISDDGSTDETLNIISEYNDKRIKVFHHIKEIQIDKYQNFRYATRNFENALNYAKGDVIFLSDQDDIWESNKVEVCLSLLKDYDFVCHNYSIIGETGEEIKTQMFINRPIHNSILMNVLRNYFRGCCLCFKSSLLSSILPIPRNIIGHDYWIGTLLAAISKCYYELTPLIKLREYSSSVSYKRRTTIVYKLKYRYVLFFEVIKRIIKIEKNLYKYNKR